MLPQTLDEQRRDGELYENGVDDNVPPGAEKRRHLYQVAQVMRHNYCDTTPRQRFVLRTVGLERSKRKMHVGAVHSSKGLPVRWHHSSKQGTLVVAEAAFQNTWKPYLSIIKVHFFHLAMTMPNFLVTVS